MGHNLGGAHDPANHDDDLNDLVKRYAQGHTNKNAGIHTVMSYGVNRVNAPQAINDTRAFATCNP